MRSDYKKIWIGGTVVLLLVIVVLSLSIRVTEITVSGNRKYTSEEIESILFPESGTGIHYIVIIRTSSGSMKKFLSWKTINWCLTVLPDWK